MLPEILTGWIIRSGNVWFMGSSNPKTREIFWRSKRIQIGDSTQTDGASIQVSKKMGCCWSSQLFWVLIFDDFWPISTMFGIDSASCKKTSKVGSGLSFSARLIWLIWVAFSQDFATEMPRFCQTNVIWQQGVTSGRFSSLLASGGALPTALQLAPGDGRRQQFVQTAGVWFL